MSIRHARRRIRLVLRWGAAFWTLMLLAAVWPGAQEERSGRPIVYATEVEALIHPVSAEYIAQTLDQADRAGADLVVVMLRTPGGLVDSTREINTRIIEADTPIVVYVGPSGTRAASAGFLITIAADVAVMAPGTHIGAAHPVSGTGSEMDDTASQKAASDVAAYARSLASQRQRNVELAEKAVTESLSFTEREALDADPPLIDLIASDLDDLLEQLDGREVRRWDGSIQVVRTADAEIETVAMTWRQRLLSAIAHPQIAVLLFSLGSLGLTIELWNPGAAVPGIVGAVCLLLAFFAFQILPINYVGLLLILFGLVLLVIEMFTPTYGLLAVSGMVSMLFGAVMLFDSPAPELQLGWPFIVSTMLALALVTGALARLGVKAHRVRAVTGADGMLDREGRAIDAISAGGQGRVSTRGEIWTAAAAPGADIVGGERVQVVAVHGMVLTVRHAAPPSEEGSES
jgi:membrane-bound serine protease (ClpP class)